MAAGTAMANTPARTRESRRYITTSRWASVQEVRHARSKCECARILRGFTLVRTQAEKRPGLVAEVDEKCRTDALELLTIELQPLEIESLVATGHFHLPLLETKHPERQGHFDQPLLVGIPREQPEVLRLRAGCRQLSKRTHDLGALGAVELVEGTLVREV